VETRLEKKRFFLNVQQKSAKGIVCAEQRIVQEG
jgi:hypothetical protein